MDLRYIFLSLLLLAVAIEGQNNEANDNELKFTIDQTWNGTPVSPQDKINITLTGDLESKDVMVTIEAPFYNDPIPPVPAGESYPGLWRYEVVEIYFLNDANHYLQIQFSPSGQYIVKLFNGTRNNIHYGFPLNFTAIPDGSSWTGSAVIPGDLFPSQVTKFNAASMHGNGTSEEYGRKFLTLYPSVDAAKADFHILSSFEPIEMSVLSPLHNDAAVSTVWQAALKGEICFTLSQTSSGEDVPEVERVKITLSQSEDGEEGVLVRIISPFYDDAVPEGDAGPNFNILEGETIKLEFRNEDERNTQVYIGPHGHYIVILALEVDDYLPAFLGLNITTNISKENSTWTAHTVIPPQYFAPQVSKFTGVSLHGVKPNRKDITLAKRPIPNSNTSTYPFFLNNLIEDTDDTLSSDWLDGINSYYHYVLETTWKGYALSNNDSYIVNFRHGAKGANEINIRIKAPFYNDTTVDESREIVSLYSHEVVDLFFFNRKDQYLQVQLTPQGRYFVILMNGYRTLVQHSLPLVASSTINDTEWIGEIALPIRYLPPFVTSINIGAVHGDGDQKEYALYTLDGNLPAPDFHNLDLRHNIIMKHLYPRLFPNRLSYLWRSAIKGEYGYKITKTWNGATIPENEEVLISFHKDNVTGDLHLKVVSPYYNDPPPEEGLKSNNRKLHLLESVEVYFANRDDQYLQIQFSPHGQYLVLFFDGKRNVINRGLPLVLKTVIRTDDWVTRATIPRAYLPAKIRKFSASGAHGVGEDRKFISLSPSQENPPVLNFHNLESFQPLDMRKKWDKPIEDDIAVSSVWESSLKGEYPYIIATTWDGKDVPVNETVNIVLKAVENSTDVLVKIEAPFYNDPSPSGEPGQPFMNLWDYEVVEFFFLNDKDQYVEVEVSPHGQHIVLLVNGMRNSIKNSLPLTVTTNIQGSRWTGEAIIPGSYFPPQVSKFNAYSINGIDSERRYMSLYSTDGTTTDPDFHNLSFFQPIQIGLLHKELQDSEELSTVWIDALANAEKTKVE